MKRYRLPLLLGVGFFVLGQVISALLNIWTSRIPADTPYLEYTPHLLLAAIVVGVGVFAWQYRAERWAEADGMPLPETPRGLMITKVRAMWIAGVLERSLYRAVQLAPGLRSDPRRVDLPVRALVQEAGGQAEDLPEGTRIVDVYDRFGGALLILGAPGAGKTTLLLELARELLNRAEADAALPIPVVVTCRII
ncbi:MAG TPA: hypothetical protein VFS21_07045 [Roseiflexaceae bacterium]|nr:hypothetical protein [Roseiflexaceae bacterium]